MKNQKGAVDIIFVGALVVVIAVGGLVYWRISSSETNNDNLSIDSSDEVAMVETLPEDLSSVKTIDEVKEIVSGNDLSIVGYSLKYEDGILVYEVVFEDGSSVYVNAITGENVGEGESQIELEDGIVIPDIFTAKVTIQNAVELAKKERPGVAIEKVEVEVEDGIIVYSVRFIDDGRVDVNASNGSILDLRGAGGERDENFKESGDDDYDDDGIDNSEDSDDDNDGMEDTEDPDDDNDGVDDEEDDDDDNDNKSDSDDNDDEKEDRSGSNSGSN